MLKGLLGGFYWKLALWLAKGGVLLEVSFVAGLGGDLCEKLDSWLAKGGMLLGVSFGSC